MTVYRTKIPMEIAVEKHYQELFGGDKMPEPTLREKIGKIIISYQGDCRLIDKHYPEGMETQERFNAFEKTRTKHLDQILSLLSAELEKLTVIEDEEIREAKAEAERLSWTHKAHPSYEKDKYLLDRQLNHTKEQLRELLG